MKSLCSKKGREPPPPSFTSSVFYCSNRSFVLFWRSVQGLGPETSYLPKLRSRTMTTLLSKDTESLSVVERERPAEGRVWGSRRPHPWVTSVGSFPCDDGRRGVRERREETSHYGYAGLQGLCGVRTRYRCVRLGSPVKN